ncbi:hypothetical protein [Flavobacterium sp. CF136]|uniref:hypothetical protein n=1 Tax=Flavobacterium sp. (strain CF136) TaxID=1144313 RepID=UPI000271966C|nr:hypothetical protein [Flavobacterium sp. CF136]EJL64930.1 hypothetical protein PMI10_01689 [Flavobacterium sp. CF136]
MTKHLLTFAVIFICSQQIFAQKASDVLENGRAVKSGHRLFLKYDITDKVLKIDAVKKEQNVDFTTLEDSTIFLVRKNAINIYLKPLNPLNYSYNSEVKIIIDPINEAAATALSSIIGSLGKIMDPNTSGFVLTPVNSAISGTCKDFTNRKSEIEKIQEKLSDSKKENIIKEFEYLKAINFDEEQTTKDKLFISEKNIEIIKSHFDNVKKDIDETETNLKKYTCSSNIELFTTKYIFTSVLKELSLQMEQQKKRLTILQTAYKLVKDMQEKASAGGGTEQLKWCIPLNEIPSKEGKISIYTITIKESGYKLSDDKEIVATESKELAKRSIRVRQFQRFVPEVSVGTAFTFLKYNSYGTTSDASGQQYVGTPTENTIKNLNIATMINFNYYIPNSSLHPLYQLGLGINSEMPTLLTGFGLRSNINGVKRLAIAGGIAMTWVKELDELKVGDKITGTDDIDKDYKFSSAPKFSPYVALQYNF